MAVWSSLVCKKLSNIYSGRAAFVFFRNNLKLKAVSDVPVRNCHDRKMLIKPSTYEYTKFKDTLHFYLLLGALPFLAIITYVNLFIGPAQLALIPEGYEPEPYEYHRHPISRFLAKYFSHSPQERHERNLHNYFYNYEYVCLSALRKKVLELMKEREDYQAWYYHKPVIARYTRQQREIMEDAERNKTQRGGWII